MNRHHEYYDGTVDIQNKAILDENGVNTDSPYVDFVAEKVGGIVIDMSVAVGSTMYPSFSKDEDGRMHRIRRLETQPRTKRIIGKALLLAGLTVGVMSQTDRIQDAFTDTVRVTYEFLEPESE